MDPAAKASGTGAAIQLVLDEAKTNSAETPAFTFFDLAGQDSSVEALGTTVESCAGISLLS